MHGTLAETTENDWTSFHRPLEISPKCCFKLQVFCSPKINFDANISRWTRIVDELNEEKRFENQSKKLEQKT